MKSVTEGADNQSILKFSQSVRRPESPPLRIVETLAPEEKWKLYLNSLWGEERWRVESELWMANKAIKDALEDKIIQPEEANILRETPPKERYATTEYLRRAIIEILGKRVKTNLIIRDALRVKLITSQEADRLRSLSESEGFEAAQKMLDELHKRALTSRKS